MASNTSIMATYHDMMECKAVFEEIGEDVRKALTDLDSLLNAKADCDGVTIYANWNSEARNIFAQKMETVFSSFRAVADECDNAATSLNMAAVEYANRDTEVASLFNSVKQNITPVNFHFGSTT